MCRFCIDDNGDFTRREMLELAGAGIAASLMGPTVFTASAATAAPLAAGEPLDVRVVYVRPPGKYWLGWPGTFWDPEGFVATSSRRVEQFGKELGIKVAIEPAPIHEPAEVEAFVKKVQGERPKGVVVFPLHAQELIIACEHI